MPIQRIAQIPVDANAAPQIIVQVHSHDSMSRIREKASRSPEAGSYIERFSPKGCAEIRGHALVDIRAIDAAGVARPPYEPLSNPVVLRRNTAGAVERENLRVKKRVCARDRKLRIGPEAAGELDTL